MVSFFDCLSFGGSVVPLLSCFVVVSRYMVSWAVNTAYYVRATRAEYMPHNNGCIAYRCNNKYDDIVLENIE